MLIRHYLAEEIGAARLSISVSSLSLGVAQAQLLVAGAGVACSV
jgi:hypothetical protein